MHEPQFLTWASSDAGELVQDAWVISASNLETFAAVVDWDGRIRPFLNELLQTGGLVIQV